MENVLQSMVKIIIIGILYTSANVAGNPQFYPPPLPYYQNENYFIPGFVPPYHEPHQVYFREQNAPPPISLHNVNSYSPPQLFYQNENYNPARFTHSNVGYSMLHSKHNPVQLYNKVQSSNFEVPTVDYKKPMEAPVGPPKREKPGFYATSIVLKDEGHPAYYQDDYSKNYQEDDYSDNYSDEVPPSSEPCLLNTPYRYFEAKENVRNKYTMCNPNLGNGIYTVKMPITLLPSRFPPRVEHFIERIQNYFSTYIEKETPKPQNESSSTAIMTMEATTESVTITNVTNDTKKNTTTEIQELALAELNPQPTVAAIATSGQEQVTQKTIVVEVEPQEQETTDNEEIVEAHIAKNSEMGMQTLNEISENTVSSTQSSVDHREVQVTQYTSPKAESSTMVQESENSSENQISNELSHSENPATGILMAEAKDTTSLTSEMNTTEDTSRGLPTSETLFEITDKNG